MKDRELRDDPPASGPPALPVPAELARLDPARSRNDPEIGVALDGVARGRGRRAAGRRGLPADGGPAALPRAPRPRVRVRAPARAVGGRAAARGDRRARPRSRGSPGCSPTTTSPGCATRVGADAVRAAAVLLLTLPGTVFVYQGDELGMADGAGADPPIDRFGRDRHRHPMQWDASPHGGFSDRDALAGADRPGAAQRRRPAPRPRLGAQPLPRLLALRRELHGELRAARRRAPTCSRSPAASTWSRSTSARARRRCRGRARSCSRRPSSAPWPA